MEQTGWSTGLVIVLGCSTPGSALYSARLVGREHPPTAKLSPSPKQFVSCSVNTDLPPPRAAAHPAHVASLSQLQLVPTSASKEGQSSVCCRDAFPRWHPACPLLPRQLGFILANGINKCVEGLLELAVVGLCFKVCSPLTGEGLHTEPLRPH